MFDKFLSRNVRKQIFEKNRPSALSQGETSVTLEAAPISRPFCFTYHYFFVYRLSPTNMDSVGKCTEINNSMQSSYGKICQCAEAC